MKLCKNLPIVGRFVRPYLSMQLMQFLSNRGTQLVMFGVDNSGRNWYTWSGHLGTQLIQFIHRGTQLVLPHSEYESVIRNGNYHTNNWGH